MIGTLNSLELGETEAKDLLKKYNPKTVRGVIKVKERLRDRLKTEYANKTQTWKNSYGRGAISELMAYQKEMVKKRFSE